MAKATETSGGTGPDDLRGRLKDMGKAHEREATRRRSELEQRLAIGPMQPVKNDADERVVEAGEDDEDLVAADPR
jgi:hypothetical protein